MDDYATFPDDADEALDPARWFRIVDGQPSDATDLETMRQWVLDGTVRPDTHVWSDGMPEWMTAARVPALVPPPEVAPPGWPEEPLA